MITKSSLSSEVVQKRIRRSFWLAKMEAIKTNKRATYYVKNRKGNNSLRIDYYPQGELVVYGSGSGMKNYVSMVLPIVEGI